MMVQNQIQLEKHVQNRKTNLRHREKLLGQDKKFGMFFNPDTKSLVVIGSGAADRFQRCCYLILDATFKVVPKFSPPGGIKGFQAVRDFFKQQWCFCSIHIWEVEDKNGEKREVRKGEREEG